MSGRPRAAAALAILALLAMPIVQAEIAPNSAPVATDQSFETGVGTAQEITLFASDVDGDPLGYVVVSEPAHGTLSGVAPSFLYTPNPGYVGSDAFTWKANDGRSHSNAATTSISVVGPSDAQTLELPSPAWYTPELHQQVLASGRAGVEIPLDHEDDILGTLGCLGYNPPSTSTGTNPPLASVSAGGCMVHPHGCTMNFVFADTSGNRYIGTAGHCVEGGGDVIMQVATRLDPTGVTFATLAKIGTVAKSVNNGIGNDFAVVKIDAGWPVVSGVAGAAGPTGVFCGDPLGQPVTHYGHGYVFLVGPGQAKFGEVVPDLFGRVAGVRLPLKGNNQTGFNWVGYGLPGDSGSGVMNDAGLAVGDLTHGVSVLGLPIPGLSFGTTMSGIFAFLGTGYSLVTVDGRQVRCPGTLLGLISL